MPKFFYLPPRHYISFQTPSQYSSYKHRSREELDYRKSVPMGEIMESTDSSSGSQHPQLPPGFRFHPTDEELVVHYLKRKAASAPLPVTIIAEIDLYKFDPWELPST